LSADEVHADFILSIRVPIAFQKLFYSATWRLPCVEPTLFLTFDDGPEPEVTLPVLDILERYSAKATFFCVGNNIQKHPQIVQRIIAEGHTIGNHTFHHLNGWKTGLKDYVNDVVKCDELLAATGDSKPETLNFKPQTENDKPERTTSAQPPATKLFRPPYGKLTPAQYRILKKQYRVIMWDVLSRDYDVDLAEEACFRNVRNHSRSGSIIVFHDSLKAKRNVLHALPETLEHYRKLGYHFKNIHL